MRTLLLIALTGCGDAGGRLVQLDPSAELVPGVLDFGAVSLRSSAAATLHLVNSGPVALTVATVALPEGFLLRAHPDRIEAGAKTTLEIVFAPSMVGVHSGEIEVHFTELVVRAHLVGSGVIRRRPTLIAEPGFVDFGVIEGGGFQLMQVVLRNDGDAPGRIDTLDGPDAPFTIQVNRPLVVEPGLSETVTVGFAPRGAGRHATTLELLGPDVRTVVALQGDGSAQDEALLCNPSAVAFGPVFRGRTAEAMLACRAVRGPVTVTNAVVEAPFELRGAASGTLATGEAVLLSLAFASAGATGPVFGTLHLGYQGAGGTRSLRVPLSAIVLAPRPADTALTVVLTWDAATDVDLHVVRSGSAPFDETGGDCHYATPAPNWGGPGTQDDPFLDRDDLDGFGPEVINQQVAADGPVSVHVHHFSDHGLGATVTNVEVYVQGERVAAEAQPLAPGELWDVDEAPAQAARETPEPAPYPAFWVG